MEYGIEEYYEEYVYGINPIHIRDNQTIREAKQFVVDEFRKLGIDISINDVRWHIDGGSDNG